MTTPIPMQEVRELVESLGQLRLAVTALQDRVCMLERRWTAHMVNDPPDHGRDTTTATPLPDWET